MPYACRSPSRIRRSRTISSSYGIWRVHDQIGPAEGWASEILTFGKSRQADWKRVTSTCPFYLHLGTDPSMDLALSFAEWVRMTTWGKQPEPVHVALESEWWNRRFGRCGLHPRFPHSLSRHGCSQPNILCIRTPSSFSKIIPSTITPCRLNLIPAHKERSLRPIGVFAE